MTVADPERELEDAILAEAGWVRHLARSLVRDDGAADLAQDVLAAAIEKPPPRPGGLRAWLRGVTLRLAARRHRQRQARQQGEARAARPLAGNQEEEAVERLRLHRRLTDAVLSLPEPYRSVVIARFFDGLTHKEIATRREVTPAVVRQQLSRALKMLRARLDRDFGSRRAWSAALSGLLGDSVTTAAPVVVGAYAVKKIVAAAFALVLLLVGYQLLKPPPLLPVPAGEAQAGILSESSTPSPDPSIQPDRVAVEDEGPGTLSVEVVNEQGAPVAGASLWVWDDPGEIRRATSDGSGRASLAGNGEPGRLFAFAEGFAPVAMELNELAGRHRIVLQAGEELQGWVRVDGQVPERLIELTVSSQTKVLPEGLPEAIVEELAGLGVGDPYPLTTDAQGTFWVAGLPRGWRGAIAVPLSEPYWIRQVTTEIGPSRRMSLDAVRTGMHLDLTQLPLLVGRVVWADTLEPISRPALDLSFSATVQGGSYMYDGSGFSIEPDDSFRHGIQIVNHVPPSVWMDPELRPRVEKVRITVRAAGAARNEVVELDVSDLTPPYQAGTIALPRAALRHVIVRDLEGHPVPGAIVQAQSLSSPTDGQGRTTVLRSSGEFRVGAVGYRIGILEPASGTGSPEDPLVFVLEPGNVLVVRLLDDAGKVSPVKELTLAWTGFLIPGEAYGSASKVHRALWGPFRLRGGQTFRDGVPVPGSEGRGTFNLDAEGRGMIAGLTPYAPLTLRITGALGEVAFEQAVIGPGPDERKEVDLVFEATPFAVRGRVFDESNRPLDGATVHINGGSTRTGKDGAFAFEPVYVERESSIRVRHRGHVTSRLDGVALGAETGPLEIRMSAGHDVKVAAVDSKGARVPVRIMDYEGRPEDLLWFSPDYGRVEPGVFLFEDLPRGRTVFWCEVLGKRYEVTHEVGKGDDDVSIEVPEMGELLVTVRGRRSESELAKDSLYLFVNVESVEDPDLELEDKVWGRSPRFLLPPGRYRVRLDEVRLEGQRELERRTLEGPVEVTVRARELVTYDMR